MYALLTTSSTGVTLNQVVPLVLYRRSPFCLVSYFSPPHSSVLFHLTSYFSLIPLCTGRVLQLTFSKRFRFTICKSFSFHWTQMAETVLSHIFAILHQTILGKFASHSIVGRSTCPATVAVKEVNLCTFFVFNPVLQ
jgi:hypothetical protein